MEFAEPWLCDIAIEKGRLDNANGHYQKHFRDLAGLYRDADAFAAILDRRADEVAYEVTSYTPGAKTSDLIMGVTRMEPGKVGDEYFLTRGHIHARGDRPEIYHTLSGKGLMQLESPDGTSKIIEMAPGQVCYVPPYWIHRSVNVGREDLVMFFAYPADSGQDYGIIERSGGMRYRIVDDGAGGWTTQDNPDWRNRTRAEIDAILAPEGVAA